MKRLYLIIDGYNLIGILHQNLEKAREYIIDKLDEYSLKRGHEITLVFDGYRSPNLERKIFLRNRLKIVYTRMGESADEYILRTISTDKREWIVVTSDRSIQKEAWAQRCIPVDSNLFMDIMDKALREKVNEVYPEEDGLPEEIIEKLYDGTEMKPSQRMGNPRKLSKKERLISRVVKEL